MTIREDTIAITVGGRHIAGTLVAPATVMPGVLFVHGWRGNQAQYLVRARAVSALGCTCLTFDLYGHAQTAAQFETVTREDNLADVVAAYDALAGIRGVDKSAIGVIGSSYGAYLAAVLTSLRPVRWLGLRAPALYKDEDWGLPKARLDRDELALYRRSVVRADTNRALAACAAFQGDVLIVESEHDVIVPPAVITNYRTACAKARSLTYRVLKGADHAMSSESCQNAYTSIVANWAAEMLPRQEEAAQPAAAALGTPRKVLTRSA